MVFNYVAPTNIRHSRLPSVRDTIIEAQQARASTRDGVPYILHWDPSQEKLALWAWPCYEDAKRVPPDELEKLSRSHFFRPPCCLCAYLKGDGSYTASRIVPLHSVNIKQNDRVRRPFVTEYVAECSTNTCGYFVVMERFYSQKALLVKYYPKRLNPHNANALDFLKDSDDAEQETHSKGFRRIFAASDDECQRGQTNRLKRKRDGSGGRDRDLEVKESVQQLGTLLKEGLSASDFWELFIECARCSHVVPRHLYPYKHECSKRSKGSEAGSNVAGGDSEDVGDDLESFLEEVDGAAAQDYPDEDQVNAGPPLAREAFESFDTDEDNDSGEDDDRGSDNGWDSDLPTVLSLFR